MSGSPTILYVAMKYDYGKPERGPSFEHFNFYDSLHNMGLDLIYFDFMTIARERGRDAMNRRLLEVAKSEKPDLMFTVLHREELDKKTVRAISEETSTTTLNWFADDHWRFEDFSRDWAPCFNWAITTDKNALVKYEALGYANVIKSQWACNHFLYRKLDVPLVRDVTFVGQPHGDRREVIAAVASAGLRVETWGTGWESGRLSQDEMIELFNSSRVNLNLSNASRAAGPSSRLASLRSRVSMALDATPLGERLKETVRKTARGAGAGRSAGQRRLRLPDTGTARVEKDQIKGRNFEIPGCGGFLLTGPAEDLASYYEAGKEIVAFEDADDLIEKARYYLAHEGERIVIAEAGYERTMREHTYVHRFSDILARVGLGVPLDVPQSEPRPGRTEEVA